MDFTKSAADGWRMRSRKSCHVSGAMEEPKASPVAVAVVVLLLSISLLGSNERGAWSDLKGGLLLDRID